MTPTPWIDPEPQPGDFDADLATIDRRFLERHPGNPGAKVRIVVSIEVKTRDGYSDSRPLAARSRTS